MNKCSLIGVLATTTVGSSVSADLLAAWTIPTAVPALQSGSTYTYGAADQGSGAGHGTLYGWHSDPQGGNTDWTSPAGNGSAYSLKSSNWAVGDYYEVWFSTIGSEGVTISWDQARTGGITSWDAQLSIDGLNWTTILAGYSVIIPGLGGTGTQAWSADGPPQSAFNRTVSLGATANNRNVVGVRFLATASNSPGGTVSIDNIMVNNNIPSPGVVALLGVAGLVSRRRR